ncbi:protein trichome birefringence-like 4 [Lycium barbarum]|uniref:protein trichome birefringence-like 4 n=1 Tax=Lycium barbarum TaxID=112863 RepID=UPI00293E076E|nr:protein trichome birefringence-like 4 [Lycium barbarum]
MKAKSPTPSLLKIIKKNNNNNPIMSELKKSFFSPKTFKTPYFRTQRTLTLAFGITFLFFTCVVFFVFNNPSLNNHSSIWFKKILEKRSHFYDFLENTHVHSPQFSRKINGVNLNYSSVSQNGFSSSVAKTNNTENGEKGFNNDENEGTSNEKEVKQKQRLNFSSNYMKNGDGISKDSGKLNGNEKIESWWEKMSHCDIFDGKWMKDEAGPLYEHGSCPHIDEPFDCYKNGRPDNGYMKFRWHPKHCNIPRLNAKEMLELLRGKRLVYVGDSLNRNMWESMVCLLRNSLEDKSRVFEASGRHDFKKEGAYSFIFMDYNCSVEFVRSPFLVQEWEVPDKNGSKKETLRLDLIEMSLDKYKGADILVFNTGHWWTHEKTSAGKGYYQEGSHVYSELNVVEAFRKAMTTWSRWIEANVDPIKTQVFFRGYSVSHFSGGEWYSGGKCDSDTEPLDDEKDLLTSLYPPTTGMLENVIRWMKAPVYYLNITRMTDFRKDGHPSVYRKPNMTDEERRSTLRYQDCSHWCLPGVPDTWNELLYAQLLMKHHQKQQQKQQIGS